MDETNAQVEPQPSQDENQHEGFQHRVNELTAKWRQTEQERNELLKTVTELTAQQTDMVRRMQDQQSAAQAAQAKPEADPLQPYEQDLDPRVTAAIKATQAAMQRQFAQQMSVMQAQQGALLIDNQMGSVKGIDPTVVARAKQLYVQAKQQGSQATPEEALRYALGDWYLQQAQKGAAVQGVSPQQFNTQMQTIPAPNPQPQNVTQNTPADFESWPLNKQIQYMEKLGLDKLPF